MLSLSKHKINLGNSPLRVDPESQESYNPVAENRPGGYTCLR